VADVLKAEQFFGQVDGNIPLFNRDPGWLKNLQNMRVRSGGHCEARGGYETLKPSGGTSGAIDTAGIIAGLHEHHQTHGCIQGVAADGISFTTDIALFPNARLFGPVANIAAAVPVLGVNDTDIAWYFGSIGKFSRLLINLTRGTSTGGSTYGVTWEYWNGAAWLALSGATENFYTAGLKDIAWAVPTAWAPVAVHNIYLYWVRCRITTIGVADQDAWILNAQILSDWRGRRMLFGAATDGAAAANNGKLRFYGQTSGGAAAWSDAFVGATTLFSGANPVYRFATFQNRLLFVNGKENKRYNNDRADDLGLAAPVGCNLTIAAVVGPNPDAGEPANFGRACVFDYAVTFSYGPGGSWGESAHEMSTTGPLAFAANQYAALIVNAGVGVPSQVAHVNLYRTKDLTTVPVSFRANAPMYKVAEINCLTPTTTQATENDSTYEEPFPAEPLDLEDYTPPKRCRFIRAFRGRVFYASNDEYPARGWWSEPGHGESVNQRESYLDLSDTGGGPITGEAVAFDAWIVWSENAMRAASDLDEAVPNIVDVPGGRGSIAPDAAAYGYGVIIWASSDGMYRMLGDGDIKRISDDQTETFGKMTIERHGRSRAFMHDGLYEIQLIDQNGTPVANGRWRYDIYKGTWNRSTISFSPLTTALAPLGHADAGVLHPFYGNTDPAVADRTPRVGEYTTGDDAVGYDCIGDVHFGPSGFRGFAPDRFAAYFQRDSGWANPVVSNVPGHTPIFKGPTSFGTPTPKVGSDYELIVANCTDLPSGTQDIAVRFKATTVMGGTPQDQRLVACYLEGKMLGVPPTG
jgi:hypothetical protein